MNFQLRGFGLYAQRTPREKASFYSRSRVLSYVHSIQHGSDNSALLDVTILRIADLRIPMTYTVTVPLSQWCTHYNTYYTRRIADDYTVDFV